MYFLHLCCEQFNEAMWRLGTLFIAAVLFTSCKIKQANHVESDTLKDNEETVSLINELMNDENSEPVSRPIYQASEKRTNDLLHTKLEVEFLWETKQLKGRADLIVKPFFHPTDSLILDAKEIDVSKVALLDGEMEKSQLEHSSDRQFLKIKLDREYNREEQYTVRIDYVANPEKVEQQGGIAISSAKGLYFINAERKDPKKPTQIWTQGETESSSCWFPTIDTPNERTTQEIYMTVDQQFKTLSNGLLIYSTPNEDGTRTDYWKMEKPHAPYLFMMAVGDFAVVEDFWVRKDGSKMAVNYYVDKDYEKHARAIFGKTPKMIGYFSDLLGVEYPWSKYHQVVVKDYVSGAMENTTAVIHGEFLHQTEREIIDGGNESIIAHELFHHWFGDLVTCESWSNLPLNESFANYSQFLWDEHEYGRMEADKNAHNEMESYILSAQQQGAKDVIRFDYANKDDMFDLVSYNKGGRILHMLRSYLGDDAFFQSLKRYLEDNAYSAAEIHNLRLAFEKTTGEDLNWFFNQWFLAGGHPNLIFSQKYTDSTSKLYVYVHQNQDLDKVPLYKLPIQIETYVNDKRNRHLVWSENVRDTFVFDLPTKPQLVNIDAQKVLLCEKKEKKPLSQWIYQLDNAPLYLDKKEALQELGKAKSAEAQAAIVRALDHAFWHVRLLALSKGKRAIRADKTGMKPKVIALTKDEHPQVRKAALKCLKKYWQGDADLMAIYEDALKDSSYNVMAQAIDALAEIDKDRAMDIARKYEKEKGAVSNAISRIYAKYGGKEEHAYFLLKLDETSGFNKYGMLQLYNNYLMRQDESEISKGLEIFEEVARNGSPWFLKLSGYQLLQNAAKTYDQIAGEHKSSYDQLLDEGNTAGAASSKQAQNKAEEKSKRIMKLVNQIKEQETDANVLQYINY